MDMMNKTSAEWEINLAALFGELIDKIWVIIVAGILTGSLIFLGAMAFLDPEYSATVKMYANNMTNQQEIKDNVSYADITASIMIANTCTAIIESDVVLDEVLERTGLDMNKESLSELLTAEPITNTEIISISIKGNSPKEVALLANTFAEVSAEQLVDIIEGSSVKILNVADIPTKPTGPGYLKIAVLGVVLGCMIAVFLILLNSIFDLRVRSEIDLEQWSYPVIGVIPDIATVKNRGGYYRANSAKARK